MENSILQEQSPQQNTVAVNEMPMTTQKCTTVQDGKIEDSEVNKELCSVESLRKVTTACHLQCLGPKEDVANVTVSSLEESGLNVSSDHVKSKESNLQQQNVNYTLEQEEITRYSEDGNPGQCPESTLSSLPLSESYVVKNADYALKSIHYDKNVEPSTYTAVPNVHAEFHEVAVWSQDYLENCCSVSLIDKNNQALDETLLNNTDMHEAVLNCCASQSKETGKIEAVHSKKRKKNSRSRKTSRQKRKVPQKNELNENMTCERGNVILEKSEAEGNMQFHSEQGVEECHKSRKSEKKTDPKEEHQTSKDTVSCEIENVEVEKHMKCSEELKSVEVNDPEKSSYGNSTCNAKTTGVPTSEEHEKVHDGEIVSRNSKDSLLEQNNALCIENVVRAAQGKRNEYRDLPKNDTRMEGVSLVVERKEIMYSQYCNVGNQTEVVSDSARCDVGTQTEVESVSAQFPERQLILEHNSGDVTNQLQQEASEHSGVSGVHTNEIVAAVEYEDEQCVEPTEQKGEMVKVGTSENSEQREIALECKTGCDQGVAVSVTRDRRRKKCSQCNDCEGNIKVMKKARSDRKTSEELTEYKFKQLHSDSVVKDIDSRNEISFSKGTVVDDPECKGVIERLKPCANVKHARKVTDTENVSNKIKRYYTRSSKMSRTGDGSTRRKSTGDGSTRRKSTGDGSGKKKSTGGGSRREKSTINCMENGGKLCSREESELSLVHENSENNITTLQEIGSSEVGDKQEQVYLRNEPLHKVKNHSAPYEAAGALVPLDEYDTASDVGMIVGSDTLSERGKEEYVIQEKEICKQRSESAKDLHDKKGNSIPQKGGAVLKQSMSQKELKHDSKSYQTEKETKWHHEEFYGNQTDLKPFQQQSSYIHEHTREAEHPKLHVDLRLAVMDDVADLNERNVGSDCLYAQHDAKENLTVIAYSITEEIIDTVLQSANTQQDDKLGNHEYIEKVPSEKTVCSGQEQQEKEVKCSENCGTWPQSDLRSRHESISLTRSHEDSEVPKDSDMFNTCTGSQKGSSLEQKCGEEKSLDLKEKETYDIIEKDPIKACGIGQTVLEKDTLQQEKTYLDDQEGTCIIHAVKVRKKSKLKSSRLRRKKLPHDKDKNVNNKDNETVVVKYEDQLELHSHQAVEDTEKYKQKYDQKGQQQSNYESKPEFSKVPLSHELGNLGGKCCEKENVEENLSEKFSENSECNVTYQMPLEKNLHLRNVTKVVPEETQTDAFCVKISEMFKDEHDLKYAENSIVECEGGDSLVSKWKKMSMELPENQDSENYICENTCSQCSKTECDAVLENDSKLDNFEGKKMSKWESMEINCDKTECKREKLLNCRGKHDDGTGENPNKDYECQVIWEGSIVHLQEQPGFKLVKGGLREKNFTDDLKFCQSEMNSAHYTVNADDQCSRFGKMSETYDDNSEGQPTEEMDKCIKNKDTYHGTEVSNLTECIESSGGGHDESECLISEQTRGVNVSEDLGRNCGISWMHDLERHIKTVLLDYEPDEGTESGNSFESSETLKCIDVKRNSPTAGCVNDECQIVWESSEAHHRQTPVVDVFDERQTKEHLPHDKDIKRKERGRIIKLKDMIDTNKLGKIYEKLKRMQKTEIEENFKFCAGDVVKGKDLCSEHCKTEPWPKFENELPFPKQHTSHVIENNLQPHSNEGNSEKLASRKNVKKKSREFSVMSECKEVGMKSAKKELVKEENGRQLNQGVKTDLSFQDTNVLEQACHSFPKYVGQTVYTENSDLRLESSLGSGPPDCKTDYLNTDPAIECVAELPECKTDYLKKSVLYEGAELSKEYDRCIKPQEDSAVDRCHSDIYLEHRGQNDIGSQTSPNNYSIQFSECNQLKHHKIKCETDVRYQQGQFSENDWETINSAKDSDYHENELKQKISAVSSVGPCASSSEDTTSSSCQLKECLKYLGGSEEAVCYEQSVDSNIKTTEDLQFTMENVAAKKEYNMSDQMSNEQQNGSDFINELQADEVQALSWEEKLLLEIYPEEMDSHFENTNPVITSDVENLKKILPKHKDYCSANVKSSTSDSNGIEDLKTSGKIQLKGRSFENDMKDVINTRFQFLVQNAKNKVNPKNLLQYGRKYYDPYRYSKFSGKSTKVIGTRFNQGDPVISVNQEQNTFVESRVPWKMEYENPVYHGDKRQTDAIKATELQKTLKELECRIRGIEARKSRNCKSMKQLQNNEADPCMKFPKFEGKSTSFGDRKLLESSSLEKIGVRCATNSKNSEDYDRKVYNIVHTETKMGLPRGEGNCKREVLVSKDDNVNHVEFSGRQSDKSAFHELENKKVRLSEIDVLQRSKVSDENMKSSELHLLQYLHVPEESDNEVELHDNSKPKSLHIEVKCSANSVNSFLNKKSRQEADTAPKNKVTRYQRGNLTWIVPDENLDSCDASEVKSTCKEPAGSSLDKECNHLKKDGEISSESENTGASNRLPQAQNNLGSAEGTKMSCKFSVSDLRQQIQHTNKINSCGDFLLGTASSGCKHRKSHDTKCQTDYMNDFDDSDSEEKHVFSTGRYKTPSKPYWYSGEFKHHTERESASFPSKFKKLCYDHKTGSESVQVHRKPNKRDDFGNIPERVRFDKLQNYGKSAGEWVGSQRELEHGEHRQATFNKYSHVNTTQRFKKSLCRDCFDHDVSESKRESKEERSQFHKDKLKYSVQNLVRRQLEVISNHVEGKEKDLRQKGDHSSDGRVAEKKYSRECPEKLSKTQYGSFFPHDLALLQLKEIDCMTNKLQENTGDTSIRRNTSSPVSARSKTSRQDRRKKSLKLDLSSKIIEQLQSLPDVKKAKHFKLNRSSSWTCSDYDNFCDSKSTSSPKWIRKSHQSNSHSSKDKSHKEKQEHMNFSEKYLSRYQGKSSSKLSNEDTTAVDSDDEDSDCLNIYQKLLSQVYKTETYGTTNSGGTGKNKHKKRVLTDEGQVFKKMKLELTETSEPHGLIISGQDMKTPGMDREQCPHSSNCLMKAAGDKKNSFSEDKCLRNTTRKLKAKECVCNGLKKSKKREAAESHSPTKRLLSSNAMDQQVRPGKKAKSSHLSEAEQFSKNLSDGNSRQGDKRMASLTSVANDEGLQNAKQLAFKKDDGNRALNFPPQKMSKLCIDSDADIPADALGDKDSLQPLKTGSTKVENKEQLPKHKNKASANVPNKKCAVHGVCSSSKHESSVTHGEPSSLAEDKTESEKKNLENLKVGRVNESYELLKRYRDLYSA